MSHVVYICMSKNAEYLDKKPSILEKKLYCDFKKSL